jgi:hypothetical protein
MFSVGSQRGQGDRDEPVDGGLGGGTADGGKRVQAEARKLVRRHVIPEFAGLRAPGHQLGSCHGAAAGVGRPAYLDEETPQARCRGARGSRDGFVDLRDGMPADEFMLSRFMVSAAPPTR